MTSLNSVALTGRICHDLELKKTSNGKPVISFALAVGWINDETHFIDITAWAGIAEAISRYFKKGSPIALKGRIATRNWTDKNGHNRKSTEVVAEHIYFIGSKKDGEADNTEINRYTKPQPVEAIFSEVEENSGGLPF